MSIVDARPGARRKHRPREHGLSLIEAVITLGLLSLFALTIERTLATAHDATVTLDSMRRVRLRADEVAYQVHTDVSAARKLFFRGTIGNEYLAALDVRRFPPARGVRLPLPDDGGVLGLDAADAPRTANMLLFVRETDPYVCPADPASGRIRYVDVYRFVCVYPHEATPLRVLTARPEHAIDLVLWRSIGFPSQPQIRSIEDVSERRRVVQELHERYGYAYAWDPDAPFGEAFYTLDALGNLSAVPAPPPAIEEDDAESPGGRLVYANFQLARTADDFVRRSRLTRDAPTSWAPNGFEVKVVGPSGRRQVWLRITVESQSATNRDVVHGSALIATIRDL